MSPAPLVDWMWRTFSQRQAPRERCILRGQVTDVPSRTPFGCRYAYLEGAGQLCLDCYHGRSAEPPRFAARRDFRVHGCPNVPSTSYLTGKRVLVTGGGGSEICRQVAWQRP